MPDAAELSCPVSPLGGSLALCTIVLQPLTGRSLCMCMWGREGLWWEERGNLETGKIANSFQTLASPAQWREPIIPGPCCLFECETL